MIEREEGCLCRCNDIELITNPRSEAWWMSLEVAVDATVTLDDSLS